MLVDERPVEVGERRLGREAAVLVAVEDDSLLVAREQEEGVPEEVVPVQLKQNSSTSSFVNGPEIVGVNVCPHHVVPAVANPFPELLESATEIFASSETRTRRPGSPISSGARRAS